MTRVQTRLYEHAFGDQAAVDAALYDAVRAVQPIDIAHVIGAALDLPPHVDLTTIEVVPTMQVFGDSSIARTPTVTHESARTT